ncbi:phosphoglycerate mutase family protein [Aspergillus novofumigatus IBT 16806]|uniref:Phosphoglycerate mutase family protein n=1 Tax=Aspergillus novofumigatus (strain IBT 16806) TaxID=1392255 RepID=A0A2I1C842_ASPN1|nr:phosphoglycerate mutase family protein [Aspergillus novofumigatus IBT 16806]PKX93755.1 phosphoglycerate mutase family protein [Aspergillus novofumigatus IBT 16806]
MPLDTIYLTRHGHRLNWTIDYKTGTYRAQFPTPTGNPADPTLTSHGVRQSHELAAHIASPAFQPKPFRVYCSPFYRCLQTIQPTVEALKAKKQHEQSSDIDACADFDVRIENGIGYKLLTQIQGNGSAQPPSSSTPPRPHRQPSTPTSPASSRPTLKAHPAPPPLPRGETIAQLHDRLATALAGIIADVDAEIAALEDSQPPDQRSSKALLICSHAAPLIAMGRALTGAMPEDSSTEDFFVFTAGLSTFRRRRNEVGTARPGAEVSAAEALAPGTKILRAETRVPDWRGGKGVGGGWDCVKNGDCGFLSTGAERGWHFNGEESFDTGPMAPPSEVPTSPQDTSAVKLGLKL